MDKRKKIVMIGPSINAMGGIASVVSGYMEAGLFSKWGIIYLNTHSEGSKLFKSFLALKAYVRYFVLLVKGEVALLHVHSAQDFSFWRKLFFIITTFLFKRPVIFHLHGNDFISFYKERCGRVKKILVRLVLNKVDYVIVLSSQWKKKILQITRKAKTICIYNSVIVPTDKREKQCEQPQMLLFLGRLGKRKGIYDLLEALARVKKKFPNVHLKCGGDGEWDFVAYRAKSLGVSENLDILGWVQGEEKQLLLRTSSIYVLPSYNEGLPMGILESMSEGLPVITTYVGGIPDVITSGQDGILIEPGNIDGLVSSLELLLGDNKLRKRMGDAARHKIIDKFSAGKVLPQLEILFQELGVTPEESEDSNKKKN